MFKFPKTEPDVSVVELPGEEFEVECRDAQSAFALLELGAETEFAFYNHPKECPADRLVLSGVHCTRVIRRIQVDDLVMLLIESRYADAGSDYALSPQYDADWNYVIEEGSLREHVVVERPGGKSYAYAKSDLPRTPRLLRVGLRTRHVDAVFGGAEGSGEGDFAVTGAARVTIGPNDYRCLRVVTTFANNESPTPNVLGEYFVADTGRTVYFRRYNGPGYHTYEQLAANPTLDYEGIEWRHWYDCIPDHAMIVGG